MGSFANSLHIRSDRADRVAAAVRDQMRTEGYVPTDKEPDEEDLWGFTSFRGFMIATAHDGWVGVLDTDLMGAASVAVGVSEELNTEALHVLVNDSDSWSYMLFGEGQLLDAFDSASAPDNEQLQRRMEQTARQMEQVMSPELRTIWHKLWPGPSTARVSIEEVEKFRHWTSTEMPILLRELIQSEGEAFNAIPIETATRDYHSHVRALRPLVKRGVDEEHVMQVLAKQAEFAEVVVAEEILREFLDLLGIIPYYAYLSYRYATEDSPSELRANSIIVEHHMKFQAKT